MDNRLPVPSGRVKLTENPVFLIGGDLAGLKRYAALREKLPSMVRVRPGEVMERLLPSAPECSALPEGWTAQYRNGSWRLAVPASAVEGVYTLSLLFRDGMIPLNLRVEVSTREPGENLIRNGSRGSICCRSNRDRIGKFIPKRLRSGTRMPHISNCPCCRR